MIEDEHAPMEVDTSVPNIARMYDYTLGGKDNFDADRRAVEEILELAPDLKPGVIANRKFLGRAVRYVAEQGIDQFLDIGAGLPNIGNVHEVAKQVRPDAHVVYVDYDPVVFAHARARMATDNTTTVIQADMREPSKILSDPEVHRLLDFSRPIAVLFVAMLHFVSDAEDPAGLVRAFTDPLAPGSYLILSHGARQSHRSVQTAQVEEVFRHTNAPIYLRSPQRIRPLFGEFELVEPGLTNVTEWRPEDYLDAGQPGGDWTMAGVGRKPW